MLLLVRDRGPCGKMAPHYYYYHNYNNSKPKVRYYESVNTYVLTILRFHLGKMGT